MRAVAELQENVVDTVRQIWLAGLGAAIVAQEEGSRMFDTLVHKGEEVEQKSGSPFARMRGTWESVTQKFDEQVAASLHRIGMPSRDEIATLTRRVDALVASVDKLRARSVSGREEARDEVVKV